MKLAQCYMVYFLRLFYLQEQEKKKPSKFTASPNKKAQKHTSFGHDLVQSIVISSEQWLFLCDFSQLWFRSSLLMSRWLRAAAKVTLQLLKQNLQY